MNTDQRTEDVVRGKIARACDSCLCERAQWYCAADDAFLCQGCDSMVHSANQLASRHERVRLGTASSKPLSESKTLDTNLAPAWQCGFARKARTPRHPKPVHKDKERSRNVLSLVPEMGNECHMFEETEAHLYYRVPIFDPFVAEVCNASNETENTMKVSKDTSLSHQKESDKGCDLNTLPEVHLPSDIELAEFAVDVETLLGMGFNEESSQVGLELIDCKEESELGNSYQENRVKVEDEEVQAAITACGFDSEVDMSRESFDWNFSYESPLVEDDGSAEEKVMALAETMNDESEESIQNMKILRLNYEGVILAWDNHGCLWKTGTRPEFNPHDWCLDFMEKLSGPAEDEHRHEVQ